jgi:PAS domain S-box-containing protein
VQPAPLPSRSRKLLAPARETIPFHYIVASIVAAALVVALFAGFGLGRQLWTQAPERSHGWQPLGVLPDPLLLAMLGAVAVLSLLALWLVLRYERRLEAFAESRARNRAIVDNMLDGAIHIDAAGCVAGMNTAAERLFGYRATELKGQPISLLLSAPLRERVAAAMAEQPHLGLPPMLLGLHRAEGQRRDGTTLPLSLAVSEVHVGGYLVYTAIVRALGTGDSPDRDLMPAVSADSADQTLA